MKRIVLPCLAAAALLVAAPARADSTAENRAAADALYDEAGKLMEQKRWAEACPKLEASQKLDPAIGTLVRLGYCYMYQGKTASAWSAFNAAEGMARKVNDKRADDAAMQARLLDPKLCRIALDVAAQNRDAGFELRRDGTALDAAVWSTPVPIDPGEHTLEALQPGKLPWTATIVIDPARPGVTTVRVPALADAPVAVVPGAVVLGVGGLGLVAGAITGGLSLAKVSDLRSKCPTHACPSSLQSEGDSARLLGNVSTAAFIAGGVAVAAGVPLLVLALRRPAAAAQSTQGAVTLGVGLGIGRIDVGGRF